MKKLLFLLILLLLPVMVYAKTPTLEEAFKVISNINSVEVIDGVTVESARTDDENIYFTLYGQEQYIPYTFENNTLSFYGGYVIMDGDNKVSGEIFDNAYASFLYIILENKSTIPYDFNNYYSTDGIKEILNNDFKIGVEYKEPTNTFGFTIIRAEDSVRYTGDLDNPNEYQIVYHYHLDGDYPVLSTDVVDGEFENPATGNYNVLITIMLISVMCIGIYSYVNREKKS